MAKKNIKSKPLWKHRVNLSLDVRQYDRLMYVSKAWELPHTTVAYMLFLNGLKPAEEALQKKGYDPNQTNIFDKRKRVK